MKKTFLTVSGKTFRSSGLKEMEEGDKWWMEITVRDGNRTLNKQTNRKQKTIQYLQKKKKKKQGKVNKVK